MGKVCEERVKEKWETSLKALKAQRNERTKRKSPWVRTKEILV